jgi:hypothetical protein
MKAKPINIMPIIQMLLVLALLVVAPVSSFGAINEAVSPMQAKDLGATIRTEVVGTNQVGVWLEFAPKARFQAFKHAALGISSCDHFVVSADLAPFKQTPESIVIYFSTNPAYLKDSTLFVFCKSNGDAPLEIFSFNVGDFVKRDSLP